MLRPIRGQVLVRPDLPPEQIGLIIVHPTIAGDNPNWFPETGTVEALAAWSISDDGEERRPFDVQVGDRVHFNRFEGKEVFWEGVRYLFMHERDIRAIVPPDVTVFHGYEPPMDRGVSSFDRDPLADRM